MELFHLNCGSLLPIGQSKNPLVTHCLLIHVQKTNDLLLIDTGLGLKDIENPEKRLPAVFRRLVRPKLSPNETAFAQIKALGFDPAQIRHIVLTHLDLDHTGGLADFPLAKVHVIAGELQQALEPTLSAEKRRYAKNHFSHGVHWQAHTWSKKSWAGIACTEPIAGIEVKIFFVSLPGHTLHHAGVVVEKPNATYVMHAGDSFFLRGDLDEPPQSPLRVRLFEKTLALNSTAWKESQDHLKRLKNNTNIQMICSHDAGFENFRAI